MIARTNEGKINYKKIIIENGLYLVLFCMLIAIIISDYFYHPRTDIIPELTKLGTLAVACVMSFWPVVASRTSRTSLTGAFFSMTRFTLPSSYFYYTGKFQHLPLFF